MAIRQLLTRGWPVLALLAFTAGAGDSAPRQAFDRLLIESGLRVSQSDQFVDLEPRMNPVLPYEHAMRHKSGDLEIRFIVRPLNRIEIEYNDPHNAAPEPEHLFPLLFESITNRLSAGPDSTSQSFPETEAMEKFNAHWAAASAFDVDPEFGGVYRNGLLIAMHRNQTADAYTLFLYNDPQRAKVLINESISIMAFTDQQ